MELPESRRYELSLPRPGTGIRAGFARRSGPVLLLGVAAAFLGTFLGQRQLFRDEATSWLLASYPLQSLLGHAAGETFPPLYPILLRAWMTLFGTIEPALRSLSVVAAVGVVLLTWRWARDAIGATGAMVAASVTLLSPILVQNARDARMYSLEAAFATLGWWVLWRMSLDWAGWSSARRVAASAVLAISVAGEVWTVYLGLAVAGLQLTYALAALVVRAPGSRWMLACVAVGALSLGPWLPVLLGAELGAQPFWTPRPGPVAIATTLGSDFLAAPGWPSIPIDELAVMAAIFGPVAIALGRTGRLPAPERPASEPGATEGGDCRPGLSEVLRGRLTALALGLDFALFPALWLVSQIHSIYDPRYLGAAVPPFAIGLAATVVTVARLLPRKAPALSRLPSWAVAALLIAPLLASLGVWASTWTTSWQNDVGSQPGRQVAADLGRLTKPGDAVLALSAETYFPLAYYLDRTGEAQRLGISLLDWHSPNDPFYIGWKDIDPSRLVEPATVSRLGWREALHLSSGATVWLVSLTGGLNGPIGPQAQLSQVREIGRIVVPNGHQSGQILTLQILG